MKDRIRQIMEDNQMTQQAFASHIGLSTASLSSIFNERTQPTLNTINAIKSKFPNISTEWLLFGTGQKYASATPELAAAQNADGTTPDLFSMPDGQAAVPIHHPMQLPDGSLTAANGLLAANHQGAALAAGQHYGGQMATAPRSATPSAQPEIRYVERPQRKITEIRVYFDDNTYESFSPQS